MTQFRSGGWWSSMPPVTKNLIIANIVIWIAGVISGSLGSWMYAHLGLHFWGSSAFNPVQLLTYMFLHDESTLLHLFFNMFTLWMFGRILEQTWGSRRFMLFYFVCGVGAALTQEVVWQMTWLHDYATGIAPLNGLTTPHMEETVRNALASGDINFLNATAQYKSMILTVGASGAVFGLLLGFAFTYPDLPLYLFFIPIPIKAKYMVVGYGVLEFFLGVSGSQSSVAHFAHLGGLLFGLLMILWWKYGSQGLIRIKTKPTQKKRALSTDDYNSGIDVSKFEDRRRLNELLDKIRLSGYASLSEAERNELRRLSDRVK